MCAMLDVGSNVVRQFCQGLSVHKFVCSSTTEKYINLIGHVIPIVKTFNHNCHEKSRLSTT